MYSISIYKKIVISIVIVITNLIIDIIIDTERG